MLKKRIRHGQASAAAASDRRALLSPADDRIDIDPALDCSRVTSLFGRPYPVQFRHQGAIDAWTRALGNTEDWRRWQATGTSAWRIRQEIFWQLEQMNPVSLVPKEEAEKVTTNRRMLAVEISANLKFHLNKGAVIEATDALETLLTNSDVDLSLPMNIVAPPYRAQYLRFGETARQYLKVPNAPGPDCGFDGVFCFFTQDSARCAKGETCWTLELIFVSKRQDRYNGHVALLGETDGEARRSASGCAGFSMPSPDSPRASSIGPCMRRSATSCVCSFTWR